CKTALYCSKDCQLADWSVHKKQCKKLQLLASESPSDPVLSSTISLQQMKQGIIHYTVGRDIRTIDIPFTIPASFCLRTADRQIVSDFLLRMLESQDAAVLAKDPYGCLYCGAPAMKMYSVPMITLHNEPPTILVTAQPLCSSQACGLEAHSRMQGGLNSKDSPMANAQVYQKSKADQQWKHKNPV
ncbi:hypothetical protein C8J56DRAFT_196548, partial [Mycena floridula]